MQALSLSEIESLRSLALQNAKDLLEEAELLFEHQRFARTYTLAHLSSEELAKLPILAAHGVRLIQGKSISWKKLDKDLTSHATKLKGLLLVDLIGTGKDPSSRNIKIHDDTLSRVQLFNTLKNTSLYSGIYQGELFRPNAVFTRKLAEQALTVSKNRLELFADIETLTQGRIAEIAKRETYAKLLALLGVTV